MKQLFHAKSLQDTQLAASVLATHLQNGACLLLHGDLGAGKTTFVQALASALGYKQKVTSPTFQILHCYDAEIPIYHMDFYRLHTTESVLELGLDELFHQGICLVEWPSRAEGIFPQDAVNITLDITEEDGRDITLEGNIPLMQGWQPL